MKLMAKQKTSNYNILQIKDHKLYYSMVVYRRKLTFFSFPFAFDLLELLIWIKINILNTKSIILFSSFFYLLATLSQITTVRNFTYKENSIKRFDLVFMSPDETNIVCRRFTSDIKI